MMKQAKIKLNTYVWNFTQRDENASFLMYLGCPLKATQSSVGVIWQMKRFQIKKKLLWLVENDENFQKQFFVLWRLMLTLL